MSRGIESEVDEQERVAAAQSFFREHSIEVPDEWDSRRLIRTYDMVRQIPIGSGCEEFRSQVY